MVDTTGIPNVGAAARADPTSSSTGVDRQLTGPSPEGLLAVGGSRLRLSMMVSAPAVSLTTVGTTMIDVPLPRPSVASAR